MTERTRPVTNSRFIAPVLAAALALFAASARGQVLPSATNRGLSVTAGGMASAFQPDYAGGGVPAESINRLYGVGAYVDMRFSRWIQLEAEGRWLRFNEYESISEDNYLIGPRLPIQRLRFKRFTPYAKLLVGWGHMQFEVPPGGSGRFTALAPGGGLDYQLTQKLTIRIPDIEYQIWPNWYKNQILKPYGGSIGVAYKVF